MKALVLSGGSMKGAFQVGAIQAIAEKGFTPDMVYGISVGALNATFLANESGKLKYEKKDINWVDISKQLVEFWVRNITKPSEVATLRSKVSLGVYTLMSKYEGILDPTPLHSLIRQSININYLRHSPTQLKVGSVNVSNCEMQYNSPLDEHFLEYVMASSSMPILMPPMAIGEKKELFIDGGIRVVAPIKQAIEDGATEIYLVSCYADHVINNDRFEPGNLVNLMERIKDITVNQIVSSDITWAENHVERSILVGKPIKLTVIRPQEPLSLNLQHFNSDDIVRLILEGYTAGIKTIK